MVASRRGRDISRMGIRVAASQLTITETRQESRNPGNWRFDAHGSKVVFFLFSDGLNGNWSMTMLSYQVVADVQIVAIRIHRLPPSRSADPFPLCSIITITSI